MARKEKTIHYIYKTTCNITGRWYIGMHSTNNLDDGYMGSGLRIRRSIRKYGLINHNKEILEFLPTRDDLVLREIEILTKELISEENCINLKGGGYGGFSSDEHKVKFLAEGVKNGRIASDKVLKLKFGGGDDWKTIFMSYVTKKAWTKNSYSEKITKNLDWSGKKHSEETKQKMSESSKGTGTGETNSQYGTCWITKDGSNKKIKKENLETFVNEGWVKGRI